MLQIDAKYHITIEVVKKLCKMLQMVPKCSSVPKYSKMFQNVPNVANCCKVLQNVT